MNEKVTASNLIDKIMDYYKVSTFTELSNLINMGQPAITKWKQRNSINAIKKKCRELGIYNEIFGDLNSTIINQGIRNENINNSNSFIKINKVLLEKAEIEASKFGLDINSYLEHLIIQDLKK